MSYSTRHNQRYCLQVCSAKCLLRHDKIRIKPDTSGCRDTAMIRFIVILLLPLALCNDPCCTSTKFTAYLIELGGYLDPKTNTPTPVDVGHI